MGPNPAILRKLSLRQLWVFVAALVLSPAAVTGADSLVVARGFLAVLASLVEHGLQACRLHCLLHVGSAVVGLRV